LPRPASAETFAAILYTSIDSNYLAVDKLLDIGFLSNLEVASCPIPRDLNTIELLVLAELS